jgi:NADH-quinone oxidoreductase subunit N
VHVLAFTAPHIDYHALAPEIALTVLLVVMLIVDAVSDRNRALIGSIAGIGLLVALVPVLTLAVDGTDRLAIAGNEAYVVDNFALVMKALFLLSGYVVVLLSTNYVAEGDYYEGEYYFLLVTSVLGMVVMASARDLITIFIALETLSIPAYMLAAWRKRDPKSNEAGLKYYLMGVFATAVMLYGMSLVFGMTGSTILVDIGAFMQGPGGGESIVTLGIVFVLIGFAFKISAVPFHTWAPDTYEGAPTPITAFLSVASKTAGFVAIMELIFVGFFGREDVWQPLFWVLAVLTMTVGNLIALRQTNIVRLFAYSSVAQAGYILAPLAVAGAKDGTAATDSIEATIVYLLVYAAMNLGAFAVIIAVARKTRSGDVSSYGGLFEYAPGLALLMTAFLFSLAGIPPLGGWFAKLEVFQALVNADTGAGYTLAVLVGVNSVVALFYYARVAQEMWMKPVPDGDRTPIRVPPSLAAALGLTLVVTLVIGVAPGVVGRLGDLAHFAAG